MSLRFGKLRLNNAKFIFVEAGLREAVKKDIFTKAKKAKSVVKIFIFE